MIYLYAYAVDKTEREVEPCGIFGGRRRMNGNVNEREMERKRVGSGRRRWRWAAVLKKIPTRSRRFPRSPEPIFKYYNYFKV